MTLTSPRRQHLSGELSGGLNGGTVLNALTVQDDAVVDELFGEQDQDWFLCVGTTQTASTTRRVGTLPRSCDASITESISRQAGGAASCAASSACRETRRSFFFGSASWTGSAATPSRRTPHSTPPHSVFTPSGYCPARSRVSPMSSATLNSFGSYPTPTAAAQAVYLFRRPRPARPPPTSNSTTCRSISPGLRLASIAG